MPDNIVEGVPMTKEEREAKEYKSLFSDDRYAKQAWRRFIAKSLESDAVTLPEFVDGHGNVTPQSEIYREAMRSVQARLKADGLTRKPMKAEILIEASVIRAAFDTSTLNVILDRTAGKVREEISMGVGQFEALTDEELELLAAHRAKQIEAPVGDE
jgi:arginyl-tRNA synthetase